MIQRLYKSIKCCTNPREKCVLPENESETETKTGLFSSFPAPVAVFSNELKCIYSNASFDAMIKRQCHHVTDILYPA